MNVVSSQAIVQHSRFMCKTPVVDDPASATTFGIVGWEFCVPSRARPLLT